MIRFSKSIEDRKNRDARVSLHIFTQLVAMTASGSCGNARPHPRLGENPTPPRTVTVTSWASYSLQRRLGRHAEVLDLARDLVAARYHVEVVLRSLRKSTPPQNRQLIII